MTTSLSTIYPLLTAWHNDRLAEQWGNECQRMSNASSGLSEERRGHIAAARLCVELGNEYAVLEIDVKRRVEEHQWDAEYSDETLDFYDALQDDSRPFYRAILQDISGNRDIFTDEFDYREQNTKQRKVK